MSVIKLTRAKRRRMKELAVTTEKICQADKRFFERFPHRRHRVRVAHQTEIESHCIVNDLPFRPDETPLRTFILVKVLAPHCRLRVGFRGPEGADTDVSEEMCCAIYEAIKADNPRAAQIEAQMVEALERLS